MTNMEMLFRYLQWFSVPTREACVSLVILDRPGKLIQNSDSYPTQHPKWLTRSGHKMENLPKLNRPELNIFFQTYSSSQDKLVGPLSDPKSTHSEDHPTLPDIKLNLVDPNMIQASAKLTSLNRMTRFLCLNYLVGFVCGDSLID